MRELTEEHKRQIEEAFNIFDHNNDNQLEFYEVRFAMRALGFEATRQDLAQLLPAKGARRTLGRDAFTKEMTRRIRERDPEEEIRMAFELFDTEKTGKLDFDQLKTACQEVGESINDEELRAMIDIFDTDGDGALDLHDFTAICQGL